MVESIAFEVIVVVTVVYCKWHYSRFCKRFRMHLTLYYLSHLYYYYEVHGTPKYNFRRCEKAPEEIIHYK